MPKEEKLDRTDARLLGALVDDPRATVLALAEQLGISRNTVQSRLARLQRLGVLAAFDRLIDPGALGYPLTALIRVEVSQRALASIANTLAGIDEVIEVLGLSGSIDLLVRVVARDAEDLYRIAGQILATPGVQRTETSLAMRRLVEYRIAPLLGRLAKQAQ